MKYLIVPALDVVTGAEHYKLIARGWFRTEVIGESKHPEKLLAVYREIHDIPDTAEIKA
jgi:hypothetical protein